jgi:triphosphatase
LAETNWEEKIVSDRPDLKLAKDTALEPLATDALRRKLQPVFETMVDRTIFPIHSGEADLELALDRGYIKADGSREPISEIEIELKSGDRRDCRPCGAAGPVDTGRLRRAIQAGARLCAQSRPG